MAYITLILTILCFTLKAFAQTCTTLQPVFEQPFGATVSVFLTTVTPTSFVDCEGCSLTVETFRAVTNTTALPTATTTTIPITSSTSYVCQATPANGTASATSTSLNASMTPTESLPSIAPAAQTFINELSTAILYAELFSNARDIAKLCAALNPAGLDGIPNPAINGTAVQQEVCALAAIQTFDPSLAATVIEENQIAVTYLATALFAVQVAGGYAGGPDLATLCGEIDAELINNIFIGYLPDPVGTEVKDYVCSAASATASASPKV